MSNLAQVTLHDLDTLRTDTSIVAVQPSEASHATPQRTPEEMLAEYSNALHRTALRFRNWRYTGGDTLSNPYYFYVFSSPTFYEGPMHQRLGRLSYKPQTTFGTRTSIYDGSLAQRPRLDMTEDALAYIYTTRPWYVRHMDTETMPSPTAGEQTPVRPHVNLTEKVERTPENPAPQIVEQPDIEVHRPNFWNLSAEASFQLIQNYVSDNWYKGGESNHSLLASIILQANYNNKQKLRWDNKLEMKLGFQSSNSDEQHKYKTNSDLLRMTNELGVKATTHWYYSIMLQSWTQFYRGYKKNDTRVYSDFMSPFESLLTFGMKFTTQSKNKRFSANVNLSPLAVDFKYVDRLDLSTTYGLDEAHHTKWEYGSNITATLEWTLMTNVRWKSRFYYYTNYRKAQVEWENTFDLTINKYLTTQLFLYPRFDDSVKRKEGSNTYFQFKEYLSLGVKLNF